VSYPSHHPIFRILLWKALTNKSGHALRRNAAGAFGPDLAKKLSQLVKMEKNVMRSMETVAKERMEVAVRRIPGIKILSLNETYC